MNALTVFLIFGLVGAFNCQQNLIDGNVTFTVWVNGTNSTFKSPWNDTNFPTQCPLTTNIAMIVHGWTESISNPWVKPLVDAFLLHNGGCVVFMDYSKYSSGDYGVLCTYYEQLRNTLTRKLREIGGYGRMLVWGFSFGARLAQGAGYNLTMANGGTPVIKRLSLCDPAGPGFDGYLFPRTVDPQRSAENTDCVNTSIDKGTSNYNCTQNYLMGYCGQSQYAATVSPRMSHGLCPWFYINAFTTKFVNYNYHKCTNPRLVANNTALDARMGFYSKPTFKGVVFIGTSKCQPFELVNGTIYNYPKGTTSCPNW